MSPPLNNVMELEVYWEGTSVKFAGQAHTQRTTN